MYRIVNKIICSLQGVTPPRGLKQRFTLSFPRCFNLAVQEPWAGLACLRQRKTFKGLGHDYPP